MTTAGGRLDPAQVRALFRTWTFLSFFGPARRRGEAGGSTLTTALFSQGTMALVFAALLFPETPPIRFAAATLSLTAGMASLAVLAEYQESAGGAVDRIVVGTAPVTPLTFAVARGAHAMFLLALVAIGLAIVPGVLAFWVGGSLLYALGYMAASLVATILIASLLNILLRAVERIGGGERAAAAAAGLRAALLAAGFVVLVLGFRAVRRGPETFPGGIDALRLFPTYWFARLLEPLGGRAAPPAGHAIAVVALAAAVALANVFLARGRDATVVTKRRRAQRPSWIERVARRGPEHAFCVFTMAMIRRERSFRVRAIPLLILPLVMGTLGTLVERGPVARAFMVVVEQFPLVYLPVLLPFLRGSENADAAWIAATAPGMDMRAVRRGAALAVLARLAMPVFAAMLVVHSLAFGPLDALPSVLFALGFFLVGLPGFAGQLDVPPFSQPADTLKGASDLQSLTVSALIATVLAVFFAGTLDRPELSLPIAVATLAAGWLVFAYAGRPRPG